MAKFKLTLKNSFTMLIAFLGSFISSNVYAQAEDAADSSGSSPKAAGDAAKEKLIAEPQNTIYSVKRLMGKSYQDVSDYENYFGYKVIDEDTDSLVKIRVKDESPENIIRLKSTCHYPGIGKSLF